MSEEKIIDPVRGASRRVDLSLALVSSLPVIGPILAQLIKNYIDNKIIENLIILESSISEKGLAALDDLTESQREYLVPSAYIFIEQVRLGEYRHNLRVLSEIISRDLEICSNEMDSGKTLRAANRLRGMERRVLVALSRLPRAFETSGQREDFDGFYLYIDGAALVEAYRLAGASLSHLEAMELLHELSVRGLITSGDSPQHLGGTFYFKNSAFNEVIEAVSIVAAEVSQKD